MTEGLLTAAQLAEQLGVSTATVLDRWEAGQLPGFTLWGRSVRFRPSEVEAWVEAQRGGPPPPALHLSPEERSEH
ncbi:MAG TPA: helix-turn-helix domain-containing protein [Streptosporangiaceae bacterium]|jgi:excisionase family DNA binding protein|nr:helix-turn-helix domain-containing protein [Streptosporangiaceae bacterium]